MALPQRLASLTLEGCPSFAESLAAAVELQSKRCALLCKRDAYAVGSPGFCRRRCHREQFQLPAPTPGAGSLGVTHSWQHVAH